MQSARDEMGHMGRRRRHLFKAVSTQHPWNAATRQGPQHPRTMPLIQATQQLIEQQQTWPCGECPREQHKAALPVRELEQLPTRQPRNAE